MQDSRPPLKVVPDRRAFPRERRRSIRVECRVPVVVRWEGPQGSAREERTETRVINAHGCLLLLKAPLGERTLVELENEDSHEVRRGRVAWSGGVDSGGYSKVAVELEDPDPKFWGHRYVDFLLWAALHGGELKGPQAKGE